MTVPLITRKSEVQPSPLFWLKNTCGVTVTVVAVSEIWTYPKVVHPLPGPVIEMERALPLLLSSLQDPAYTREVAGAVTGAVGNCDPPASLGGALVETALTASVAEEWSGLALFG